VPKFTNLGDVARPPLSSCQISSRSEKPSTRYLLPKFVDFVDSQTDRQTKTTVNDMPPSTMRRATMRYKSQRLAHALAHLNLSVARFKWLT